MDILNLEFIDKWQTLVGAALGTFLAGMLSAIGFWGKSKLDKRNNRKESLRRIEVLITICIQDFCVAMSQLEGFLERLDQLVKDIEDDKDEKHFSLEIINFPPIRQICHDFDLLNLKTKSFYLHNKLLIVTPILKDINEVMKNFASDFGNLIRRNELLINIMLAKSPNPNVQKEAYAKNLSGFSKTLREYVGFQKERGLPSLFQIKTYNNKIRSRFGRLFFWKHEGISFKYFKSKKEIEKYSQELDALDRIDLIVKGEVESMIKEVDIRTSGIMHNVGDKHH